MISNSVSKNSTGTNGATSEILNGSTENSKKAIAKDCDNETSIEVVESPKKQQNHGNVSKTISSQETPVGKEEGGVIEIELEQTSGFLPRGEATLHDANVQVSNSLDTLVDDACCNNPVAVSTDSAQVSMTMASTQVSVPSDSPKVSAPTDSPKVSVPPDSPKVSAPTDSPKVVTSTLPTQSTLQTDIKVPESLGRVGRKNFDIIRLLGRGAVGKVYFVKSKGLNKNSYFAMKKLDKLDMVVRQKVQRALNEKNILGKANHPFIVTLHYCFQTNKSLYLVMQYCAGGEFAHLLQTQPGGVLQESQARFYACEVLLALEYLHVMGFVYRDLKPGNILVHASGHIMLADFDLSYISESQVGPKIAPARTDGRLCKLFGPCGTGQSSQTIPSSSGSSVASFQYLGGGTTPIYADRATSFVGTNEYMAPEIIMGEKYSGIVDWWSFGILLYEMVCGDLPFEAEDQIGTFAEIADETISVEFPSTKKFSRSYKRLVKKLLRKNVKKRLIDPFKMKNQSFFKGVEWALVRNQTPPIVPCLKSEDDTSNFPDLVDDDDADSSWAGPIEEGDENESSDEYSQDGEEEGYNDEDGSLNDAHEVSHLYVDVNAQESVQLKTDSPTESGSPRKSPTRIGSPRKHRNSDLGPKLFGEFTFKREDDPHWEHPSK